MGMEQCCNGTDGKTEVLGGKTLLTVFMSDKGKWRSAEYEAGVTAFSWYSLSEDGRHLRIQQLLLQTLVFCLTLRILRNVGIKWLDDTASHRSRLESSVLFHLESGSSRFFCKSVNCYQTNKEGGELKGGQQSGAPGEQCNCQMRRRPLV